MKKRSSASGAKARGAKISRTRSGAIGEDEEDDDDGGEGQGASEGQLEERAAEEDEREEYQGEIWLTRAKTTARRSMTKWTVTRTKMKSDAGTGKTKMTRRRTRRNPCRKPYPADLAGNGKRDTYSQTERARRGGAGGR